MATLIKRIVWAPYAYLIDACLFLLPFQKLIESVFLKLNLKGGEIVLDAGCGTGNLSHYIDQQIAESIRIVGVDSSASMLKKAKVKNLGSNFSWQKVDLNHTLPFEDRYFDAVFSCHVLYNLADPAFTVSEFYRVLKPGGTLVLVTPQTNNPSAVLSEHFRQIFLLNKWLCLAKTFLYLPWLILLSLYNMLLSAQSATSSDFFYTEKEVAELLVQANFQQITTQTAYAEVDILAVAKKEVCHV